MQEAITETFNSVLNKFTDLFIPFGKEHPLLGVLVIIPAFLLIISSFFLIVIYYWLIQPEYMKKRKETLNTSLGELSKLSPEEVERVKLESKSNLKKSW